MVVEKQMLYEIAEWLITGLVLLYGAIYFKQIVAYVLTELYKFLVQNNMRII